MQPGYNANVPIVLINLNMPYMINKIAAIPTKFEPVIHIRNLTKPNDKVKNTHNTQIIYLLKGISRSGICIPSEYIICIDNNTKFD